MAVPCVGAAIHRWGGIGHWGRSTCWAEPFGVSAIGVITGPGLAVADGAGPGVVGAIMSGPGVSVVNPQECQTGTGICGAGGGLSGPSRSDKAG